MIKTVASVSLPVLEKLEIKKIVLKPAQARTKKESVL